MGLSQWEFGLLKANKKIDTQKNIFFKINLHNQY